MNKKFLFGGGFVVLVLLVVGVGFYMKSFHQEKVSVFQLQPKELHQGGIFAESTFTLTSSQPVRVASIKKYLSVDPVVAVNVKQLDTLGKEFELSPEKPLDIDTVYSLAIKKSPIADKEYSWAYQVQAPFQVIQTTPMSKTAYIPVNTALEIKFNRTVGDISKYFEIQPNVSGHFENHDDSVVFIPEKELPYKTLFSVKIKKDFPADKSTDEKLSEDYGFVFETEDDPTTRQNTNTPSFSFSQKNLWDFTPSQEPTFTVESQNMKEAPLSVYRFTDAASFIKKYKEVEEYEYSWTRFYKEKQVSFDHEKKILSFSATIEKHDPFQFIRIPQKLEEGFYSIEERTSSQDFAYYTWFQVSPLIGFSALNGKDSLLWLKDAEKKEGVSGASIYLDDKQLGKTDQRGVFITKTPPEFMQDYQSPTQSSSSSPSFFTFSKDGHTLVMPVSNKYLSKPDQWWSVISVDKPIYLPTDTIHLWGVMKRRDGTDFSGNEVTIKLTDGYGYSDTDPFYAKSTARISSFSTVTGSISYTSLRPGFYSLGVFVGENLVLSQGITIATYIKPVYSLSLSADKQAVFVGDSVTYSVKANFFDGTPVSRLDVSLSGIDANKSTQLKLNELGEGKITSKIVGENALADNPGYATVSVAPTNAEEGEISASTAVLVFRTHQFFTLDPIYKDHETDVSITVQPVDLSKNQSADSAFHPTSEYLGKPTQQYPVKVHITEISYNETLLERRYDPYTKTTYPVYSYDRVEKKLQDQILTTGTDGKAFFTWKGDDKKSYEMTFSLQDEKKQEMSETLSVYHGGNGWYQNQSSGLGISLKNENPKKSTYKLGDEIAVTLQDLGGKMLENGKDQFLFLRSVNGNFTYSISDSPKYAERFSELYIPNVQMFGVWFNGSRFLTTDRWGSDTNFSFDSDERKLSVTVKADKDRYRPKDSVHLSVDVKDSKGVPRQTEVNVAVIDEALKTFGEQEDILPSLYRTLYAYPFFYSSHEHPIEMMAEGGGCFSKGTRVLTSQGERPIEDIQIGDEVLTREHPNQPDMMPARVWKMSSHFAYEHVMINKKLTLTANHQLYVNGEWKPAGSVRVGDILVTDKGVQESVTSLDVIHEWRKVYNIEITPTHTFFAEKLYVHNQEKGDGAGAARSDFQDVVLFKTLTTNSQGHANLSFKVPDNLTSWFVTVQSFTKDLFAGNGSLSLPVSLPFFVDTTLSSSYLTGDDVLIRLRTFGNARVKENILYTLESDTLPFKKIQQKGTDVAEFHLGKLPKGAHSLRITAQSGSFKDTLIRPLTIVDTYVKKTQAEYYDLSEKKSPQIKGADDGMTTLRFCSCDQGKYASFLEWNMYPGIRLDDSLAQFFAQDMLKKYFKKIIESDPPSLQEYQRESGGLALLPYSQEDIDLSALASKAAKEYPSTLLNGKLLESYLNQSLADTKSDVHRISAALYGLSVFRSPVLSKVQKIKDDKNLTLKDQVYLALALETFGAKEEARNYYGTILRPHIISQEPYAFVRTGENKDGDTEITALLALLATRLDEKEKNGLTKYLFDTETKDRSINLERMITLETLMPTLNETKGSFTYKTSKRTETIQLKKGESFSLILDPTELASLSFSDVHGQASVVSEYDQEKKISDIKQDASLTLERWYEVDGKKTTELHDGDLVKVVLAPRFGSQAHDGGYEITDYLPSGLHLLTQTQQTYPSISSSQEDQKKKEELAYPIVVENQKIQFVAWNWKDQPLLYYYARVVSKGEYKAEQAMLQSTKTRESVALSQAARLTIK